jgi:hypothetical protein
MCPLSGITRKVIKKMSDDELYQLMIDINTEAGYLYLLPEWKEKRNLQLFNLVMGERDKRKKKASRRSS